jgi:hypothetical protein
MLRSWTKLQVQFWIRHVALLDAVDAPIVAAWMSDRKALARMSSHAVRDLGLSPRGLATMLCAVRSEHWDGPTMTRA